MNERREVSADELIARRGDQAFMDTVQVSGSVRILDKDGNVKSELPITSLEVNKDLKDAT